VFPFESEASAILEKHMALRQSALDQEDYFRIDDAAS
jgi:hypothetical protein